MSILEIKASIAGMTPRQRRALQRHLASLELRASEPRPGTVAWRKEMARRIDAVKAGKGYTHDEVRALIETHCR